MPKTLTSYKDASVAYEVEEDVCDLAVWLAENPGKTPEDVGLTIEDHKSAEGVVSKLVVQAAKPGHAKRKTVQVEGTRLDAILDDGSIQINADATDQAVSAHAAAIVGDRDDQGLVPVKKNVL